MNWATIMAGILAWFESGTGLDVVWMNGQRPMTDKPFGVLQITSVLKHGQDEVNYDLVEVDAPGLDYLAPTVSGLRSIVVQCQVISRNQNGGYNAITYLEQARAAVKRPITRETLETAGVTIYSSSPIVVLDTVFDKRYESRAAFDTSFGIVQNTQYATEDDATSWIEQTEITSALEPVTDTAIEFVDEPFGVLE
jgi:hypothetical protein